MVNSSLKTVIHRASMLRPHLARQCLLIVIAIEQKFNRNAIVNSKHKKTLSVMFAKPVTASLGWVHIESLFTALGAQKIEGSGSRVRFILSDVVGTFHRPYPAKEGKPYQVAGARRFLEQAGIKPSPDRALN